MSSLLKMLPALSTVLAKAKPQDSVLNDATIARHILDEYPALQRQAMVIKCNCSV